METVIKKSLTEIITESINNDFNNLKNDSFSAIRISAFEHLNQIGFPNRKNEEYKYANPEKFFRNGLQLAKRGSANVSEIVSRYRRFFPEAKFAVIIDGYFSTDWSDVKIKNLHFQQVGSIAKIKNDYFAALNTSLFPEAVCLEAQNSSNLTIILNITIQPNSLSNPRIIINADKNVAASFIEIREVMHGAANAFCNLLTEIKVSENARINYYRLQNAGDEDNGLSTIYVAQEKDSYFDTNTITLSGGWIRNNLTIELQGTCCETHLNGLLVASNTQLTDNHTLVDHQMPHCNSNQTYKAILKDKSTGIFNGKIFVQRDAQKTNAYQSSKNILLSDDATMNTKPQLEIYADDVRCSHGSSTGKIDKNALFYLKARGIGEESAKQLLLMAFANEVTNKLDIPAFKEFIESLLEDIL